MAESLRLILIEDNLADAELILQVIRKSGIDFDSRLVQTREELIEAIPLSNRTLSFPITPFPLLTGRKPFRFRRNWILWSLLSLSPAL
jgi:hypothetical protein